MNDVHLRRSDETVEKIIGAAFPGWRGQRVVAVVTDTVTLHGTMWDEGSKRDYVFLRLADMARVDVPQEQYGARSDAHHTPIPIPDGVVVVVLDIWGQREKIEIHSPAANITPMLSAPPDLTDDERTVLKATAAWKSSYGGIKNYRFTEASRYTGITQERWDAAKDSLIGKRFLNRAGAITPEGRNAIGSERF